jgi:replicative DNA helicase
MTGTAGGKLIRVPALAPHDLDAEQAVIGAVLLTGAAEVLTGLATDPGLKPEHFYRDAHREIWRAMLALERDGEGVDTLTVRGRLEATNRLTAVGGRAVLDGLAGVVPALGNVASYAAAIIANAKWRNRVTAATMMLEAASTLDEDAFDAAERTLASEDGDTEPLLTPERLGERFYDWLADDGKGVIETPLPKLNDMLRGGLRPGATTVIGAWTSMGKSVLVDQLLEHARDQGVTACAYINEMSDEERVARLVAARTGVAFDRILGKDLTPREWKQVLDELPRLPFAIQPCAGWTAEQIARHVRRHRWGLFAVDLATLIPASTTQEWADVSKTLTVAARQSGAHGLIVLQLNQTRNDAAARPHPALRDLKWTGAWADDAASRAVRPSRRRRGLTRDLRAGPGRLRQGGEGPQRPHRHGPAVFGSVPVALRRPGRPSCRSTGGHRAVSITFLHSRADRDDTPWTAASSSSSTASRKARIARG